MRRSGESGTRKSGSGEGTVAYDSFPTRTVLSSASLGFVLGAVVCRGPIYSLEIAQVVAGRVNLSPQLPMYAQDVSVISPFLVQIPAMLIRLGVPEYVLCVIMSGLVAALAFAAVSICAWAFSQDRIFTLAAPVLFLALQFAGHKYPIFFPAGPNDTGIAGFFAALLAVGLASLGPSRSAAVSLGVVPLVHPTLAVGVWLGCAIALVFTARTERLSWVKYWPWFLAAGAGALGLGWILQEILACPPAQFLAAGDSIISAVVYSVMLYFDYHRQPLGLWAEPWRMLPFFEIDLYLVVFLSVLMSFCKTVRPAVFLLKASVAWTATAALLTVIDDARPGLLPLSVKAFMIARWLNLNVPLFILAVIGSLTLLIKRRFGIVALVVLTLALSGLAFGFVRQATLLDADWKGASDSLTFHPINAVFPFAAATALVLFAINRHSEVMPSGYALRSIGAAALVVAALVTLGGFMRAHHVSSWTADGILGTESERTVFAAARSGQGLIIAPPWICSWAQLQTDRGILPDAEFVDVLPYVPRAAPAFEAILRDVYGVTLLSPAGWRQYESLPRLWRQRPTVEWLRIRQQYGATQVLVPANWSLALPKVARSPDLALYDIPAN